MRDDDENNKIDEIHTESITRGFLQQSFTTTDYTRLHTQPAKEGDIVCTASSTRDDLIETHTRLQNAHYYNRHHQTLFVFSLKSVACRGTTQHHYESTIHEGSDDSGCLGVCRRRHFRPCNNYPGKGGDCIFSCRSTRCCLTYSCPPHTALFGR